MKVKLSKIAKVAIIGIVGASVVGMTIGANAGTKKGAEKCYGIAKKGKNDCGGKGHACQGQSTTSGSSADWILVMKGNCNKIVNGRLTPPKKK